VEQWEGKVGDGQVESVQGFSWWVECGEGAGVAQWGVRAGSRGAHCHSAYDGGGSGRAGHDQGRQRQP